MTINTDLPKSIDTLIETVDKSINVKNKWNCKRDWKKQIIRFSTPSTDIVIYVGLAAILTSAFVGLILAGILVSKSSIAVWVVSVLLRSKVTFSKVLAVKLIIPILGGGSAGLVITSFIIPIIPLRKHLIIKEIKTSLTNESSAVDKAIKDIENLNLKQLEKFLTKFTKKIEDLTYTSHQKKIFYAIYRCLIKKTKEVNDFKDTQTKCIELKNKIDIECEKLKKEIDTKFPYQTKKDNVCSKKVETSPQTKKDNICPKKVETSPQTKKDNVCSKKVETPPQTEEDDNDEHELYVIVEDNEDETIQEEVFTPSISNKSSLKSDDKAFRKFILNFLTIIENIIEKIKNLNTYKNLPPDPFSVINNEERLSQFFKENPSGKAFGAFIEEAFNPKKSLEKPTNTNSKK